jgi:hypothetical protein
VRKKFTIYQNGVKYKPAKDCLVVMTSDGVSLHVMKDYYDYVRKLSDVIGSYDVFWRGEENE